MKGEGRAHRVTTVVAEKEISALVPGVSELRIYQADGLGLGTQYSTTGFVTGGSRHDSPTDADPNNTMI